MRLRLGRPDIGRYTDRFTVPGAKTGAPLSVTWLGVSTLLLDDGSSALLTDGYFSRPGLARVVTRKVSPAPARINGCLSRAGIQRLAGVVVLHTHVDHALNSAVVAERTGAVLVGSESAANIARSGGARTRGPEPGHGAAAARGGGRRGDGGGGLAVVRPQGRPEAGGPADVIAAVASRY